MGAIDAQDVYGQADIEPTDGQFLFHDCMIHHLCWGNDEQSVSSKPTVVFLHGFMQSAHTWDNIARALSGAYRVYALDFVGHGHSAASHSPQHYTYQFSVDTVAAFLREVVCKEDMSAHVVGYSMGGRVALGLLHCQTALIHSLVLESCNLGCATEEEREAARRRNEGWIQRLRNEGLDKFVTYWEDLPLFATQKRCGFNTKLRAERLEHDAEALALCLEGTGKHAMPPTPEICADIASYVGGGGSVTYLWGEEDAKSGAIAQMLQNLGVNINAFPCGHNIHLEEPMRYLEKINTCLRASDS